mgnify:CR=1 FL=1
MGLLGSLFSAAADIAKETITETMNQNETDNDGARCSKR